MRITTNQHSTPAQEVRHIAEEENILGEGHGDSQEVLESTPSQNKVKICPATPNSKPSTNRLLNRQKPIRPRIANVGATNNMAESQRLTVNMACSRFIPGFSIPAPKQVILPKGAKPVQPPKNDNLRILGGPPVPGYKNGGNPAVRRLTLFVAQQQEELRQKALQPEPSQATADDDNDVESVYTESELRAFDRMYEKVRIVCITDIHEH